MTELNTNSIKLNLLQTLLIGAGLTGLYLLSLYNYLLFHSLAELFTVLVAIAVFVVAWNTRNFIDNQYFLFIGIAYLYIGILDTLHTLAYTGMGVFLESTANLPTQLWISARLLESLSLLAGFFLMRFKLRLNWIISGFTLLTSVLLLSIAGGSFPVCYIPEQGLTLFKIISEYIIVLFLALSVFIFYKQKDQFDPLIRIFLTIALLTTIAAELAFTSYVNVYGDANMIGHLFKCLSFYFIYKAIVETGLRKPYALLFNTLQQRNESLKQSEAHYRQERDFINAILDTAGALIVVLDNKGQIIRFNRKCEELTGYTLDEVKNKYFGDIFLNKADSDDVQKVFQEHLAGCTPYQFENDWLAKDGTRIRVSWSNTCLRRENDQADYVIAIGIDITERYEQQEARKRELSSLENYTCSTGTNKTSESFGLSSIMKSDPELFTNLTKEFTNILYKSLEKKMYKVTYNISEDLRNLAEQLGLRHVGPRDVVQLYVSALKKSTPGMPAKKAQALSDEGRLLLIELMGYLASYYQNRCISRLGDAHFSARESL